MGHLGRLGHIILIGIRVISESYSLGIVLQVKAPFLPVHRSTFLKCLYFKVNLNFTQATVVNKDVTEINVHEVKYKTSTMLETILSSVSLYHYARCFIINLLLLQGTSREGFKL